MSPADIGLSRLASDIASFMEQGGPVMWPLVLTAVLVWAGIGVRIVTLKRGFRGSARKAIDLALSDPDGVSKGFVDAGARMAARVTANARVTCARTPTPGYFMSLLDDALHQLEETMSRFRTLVRSAVSIAPLLGLLGTVTGMIEMFQSLGDKTFYSQSGGVANGIAEALFTTEFGLVIAIPGLIIGLLLDRKEDGMKQDLLQIKEYFSGHTGEGA